MLLHGFLLVSSVRGDFGTSMPIKSQGGVLAADERATASWCALAAELGVGLTLNETSLETVTNDG
jgi:hypothetical protein